MRLITPPQRVGSAENTRTFRALSAVLGATSGDFDIQGWLARGTVGFNWQWNQLVLGVEGDIAWSDINGGNFCAGGGCFNDIDIFATARARIGLALDRFMPYITGGGAFADITDGQSITGISVSDWVAGWTAGGGVEVGITNNLSFKGEALWVDIDGVTYNPGIPVNVAIDDFIVARGGINWRF